MTLSTDLLNIDEEALLNLFLHLVQIDSPSGQEEAVCQFLIADLNTLNHNGRLSYHVDEAGNLIVTLKGDSDFVLGITAHMDVVPPCIGVKPVVKTENGKRIITTDGTTVLGADDKSALAAILLALRIANQHQLKCPTIKLALTVKEEVELQGAVAMSPEQYRDIDFMLAFDTSGPQGTMIYEQPSYYKYTISVEGKSSHAGIAPEAGVNAISILGQLLPLLPQGRIDSETTTNLGTLSGGKALNVVADYAEVQAEVRSHEPQTAEKIFEEIKQHVAQIQQKHPEAKITFNVKTCFEHYRTDLDLPHAQVVRQAVKAEGLEERLIKSNGASDLNVFAKNGIKGVVLSAGYVAPHTLHESVALDDMVTMTRLILRCFKGFAA